MAYKLVIPESWYKELRWQGQDKGFRPTLLAALIMQESSWDPNAKEYIGGQLWAVGLGQISRAAAADVEFTGTWPDDLYDAVTNIGVTAAYLRKSRNYALKLRPREVELYGQVPCALSVYNQGPSKYRDFGITRNYTEYVKQVLAWEREIAAGGIYADTGETAPPAPPPDYPTPPPPVPPETPPDLLEDISKWADLLRKELEKEKQARPWPPAEEFKTEVGMALYNLATMIRDWKTDLIEWLGELTYIER